MTGIERISRQLKRQSVDRIGAFEDFWALTIPKWVADGKMKEGENPVDHFEFDLDLVGAFNYMIHPEAQEQILEEDENTKLILNGNHARLRMHKKHASTPEHVGFEIAVREDWERLAKPFLTPDRTRIRFDAYRTIKARAAEYNRFFCWAGIPVFECIHPICGHENMLMGMALDPEWVSEMAATYADLNIRLMEILFAEEGQPDGIWFYEDMGFKGRPFMSPDMYRELIMPHHRKLIDFAHGRGLPVIMHSCGFVEPLLPYMVEAGIDCLEAMEVKAGMDLLRIYKNFGDRISLMGGLDVRPVVANDFEGIRRELESKIPFAKKNYGFIFHSDHSIPESVEYDTYRYFLDLGRKLGTY
ncbi:MAG: methylcobalamin:coenzyme M methyltransferase [Lentisphaerae bacterium ADurb.Bin242]|nr:MAG: methylcobalamin:coenzyme M methyltransferase [Lentisphaerae bacterium ADurb.Bin242]